VDSVAGRSHFQNLNTDARESSMNMISPSAVFRDLPSLMEHFGQRDFGQGPIMILLSVRGPKQKQFFLCDPLDTIIGSSTHASISIDNDKRMSRYHCRLYFDPAVQRWMLEDMQSRHGTFVKVDDPPTMVSIGDVYLMGTTLVKVFGQTIVVHPYQQTSSGRCITS